MLKSFEDLLKDLFDLQKFFEREKDYNSFVQKVMLIGLRNVSADTCFYYTVDKNNYIRLDFSHTESLGLSKTGTDNLIYTPIINVDEQQNKQLKSALDNAVINKSISSYNFIYTLPDIDNSFFEKYDEVNKYITNSLLTIPIVNLKDEVIAVVQFVNALDANGKTIAFSRERIRVLQFLSNALGWVVDNKNLRESYGHLLESFIEVIARAIDAKSPYTGNHCQHVPVITRLLATAAVQEEEGNLAGFEMSDEEWYSLHIASWLHDCGKLTTPEYIVDKATKLETINNRIHEIRNRFEILRRDAHIEYLKKRLNNSDTQENLQKEFVSRVKQLEADFDFVANCNIGDNHLEEADVMRLREISQERFKRYFSRMKGLSWAERDRIRDHQLYDKPAVENLLQNREDHLFNNFNRGELYNLEVRRGTINKEEREKINEHIEVTIDMLKALPFPKNLSNVVEYAGSHHERMDGKGYPNGLTGDEMSVPAKIIAIADIFEALTASDRPYKETKTLSQVLAIMKNMKDGGHIDPDLYRVFIKNKVYMEYANSYMKAEQIDEINPEDYL